MTQQNLLNRTFQKLCNLGFVSNVFEQISDIKLRERVSNKAMSAMQWKVIVFKSTKLWTTVPMASLIGNKFVVIRAFIYPSKEAYSALSCFCMAQA